MVNESKIYGRTDEKEMIIEMLLNNSSDRDDDVSVYVMCGMGGLGKTTLAQLVYNDGMVESYFELRIWVCVSVDFDVERLTRAILESIEGGGCSVSNLDPLLRCLQEKLFGKRFLLVLDDVWNENHEKWDRLKNALKCGAKGCTIIVITRIQKVALIMATLPIHHMARLSEDDSWSLFKRRASGNERREENLQLDLIGKEIVKKMQRGSEIWDLPDDGSGILPSLRLSYKALPPHLRQCFAYCCIFPKDYRMEKDMLIGMWMANDFIPSKGKTTLHIGNEIFKDLVWRSFLQDMEENEDGTIHCKMHDLMHDLAQSIMRNECSIMKYHEGKKIPEKIRHLSLNIGFRKMVPWNEIVSEVPSLRSLILSCWEKDSSPFMSKQKYLRVLDLVKMFRLENIRNSEDAKKANLKGKHDLISLELYWSKSYEKNIPKNVEEVLESLQPNLNLKKLRINFFQDCERCGHLPTLGKLQSLKILKIRRLCSLKNFNHGDYGDGESSFPALETLEFNEMPSLEEWAIVDRGEICPCLQELVISGCPKLTKLPFLPALERLTIEGGNEMLFRSVINLTSISFCWIRWNAISDSTSELEYHWMSKDTIFSRGWAAGLEYSEKAVNHRMSTFGAPVQETNWGGLAEDSSYSQDSDQW
ncbi:hypothetical protein ACSBR2_034433 [Camellia fascicularis]